MSILSATSASSLASLTSGTLAVNGLVSGFDTEKVIQGLLAIDQVKLDRLDSRKAKITQEQTAFKAIEARLLALQGSMTQLSRSQNGLFESRTVAVSDKDALSAAASSNAVAGVYHLRIGSLARAHQVAAQGFDAPNDLITHGTLQLKIGDVTTTITVDSSNDTVQGLADAINNSDAAVSAAVINDGSGDGRQAYRLILSAQATGTSNRIVITNNLAATGGGATKPLFDTGSIGNALPASGFSGTSVVTSNAGAGYTGNANNLYTFTVVTGGTVGTDNGIQLSYTDSTGANTGTITVNQADVDTFVDVAQGIRVKFAAGTLVAGDKFDVKAFVPTIQDAADASVTLGSGSGALTVTSSSNQVDSLIPGVALNLLASDPAKDITLTIANDSDKMKKGVQDFVAAFNELMKLIDAQTSYSAETQQAGVLLGNRQALTIQDQIRSVMTDVVVGANPKLNYLGALGITTGDDGQLVVNDSKLSQVLDGSVAGVTLADVRKLFALTGVSSNPGIVFVTGSTKTRASATPYSVSITQAADRAALTAANALAASTVISGANNTFTVAVDGLTSASLTLAAGTYTRSALAQALQAAINGDTTLVGRHVNVGLASDKLTVTSDSYGAASQVIMQTGTALSPLGFSAGAAAQGHDVVGNFIFDGVAETAKGTGQFLVGDTANANSADLQVRVTLSPAQVGAGIVADLTVSRGVASRLDGVLTNIFEPIHGRMKTLTDGFQKSLDDLEAQKTKQSEIMENRRQSLLKQFADMEQTLSRLQGMSNFLASQASSLTKK